MERDQAPARRVAPPVRAAFAALELSDAEAKLILRVRQLRAGGDAAALLLLFPLTLCAVGEEELLERQLTRAA